MVTPAAEVRVHYPPAVTHAIENTGDALQVLVVFSDKPLDFQVPDIYPTR